jgi:hypothetical protein
VYEMKTLLAEMERRECSGRSYELMDRLARLPPVARLSYNLHVYLAEAARHEVDNILSGGLTPVEKAALAEMDARNLSIGAKETAHGLLNVHERWMLKRAMKTKYEEAVRAFQNVITSKPLDGILGDG